MSQDVRWLQRFENFRKALKLLREPLGTRTATQLSQLELQGLTQRFEFTFELAWKTLKDYLEASGALLDQKTPKNVLRESFASGLLDEEDGDIWIRMLEARNMLSHVYDQGVFEEVVTKIENEFLEPLERLLLFFEAKRDESSL